MSPAVGGTKREGWGPGHLSHGGHTEGNGVRDAPLWHNRGSTREHRSVGRLVVWEHTVSVTSARFGGDGRVCACFVSQAVRIQCRMPPPAQSVRSLWEEACGPGG